jgi:TolB-like protein
MTRLALRLCLVSAFALALPTLAEARSGSVAVMTPAARGRGAARVARRAEQALVAQLRKKSVQVVRVRGRRARAMRRCLRKSRCVRRQLSRLNVEHLVVGQVRRRGRRYLVSLRVIDAGGRTVARERLRTRRSVSPRTLLASFGAASRTQGVASTSPQAQVSDTEEPPR